MRRSLAIFYVSEEEPVFFWRSNRQHGVGDCHARKDRSLSMTKALE